MRAFGPPAAVSYRFARTVLAYLFVLCAGQLMAMAADTTTPLGYLENNYQEAQNHFQSDTNDAAAAWQFGRACFDMSTVQKGSVAEAKFATEGIAACERALALDPASAAAHYYLGMDLGQLADTKHNLSAFRMIKDIEREFLAARALDKHFDYGGPDRNLGLLYRDAPVFASIGSRSKARQHLEDAVQIAPDFPENQLNLIEVYLRWDYHTEAQRQFGELETMWPKAQKEFTGVPWQMSWADWNKRLDIIKKKLDKNPRNESPHSTP
jgi:tetratricopeptide (TPR) repeat protein